MAIGITIDGKCLVQTGTGTSNALEDLGYSVNGVEIDDQPYYLDVPTDENGGDDGPPTEVQYLGEIQIVRMELSKFDPAVLDKIDPKVLGGTTGTTTTPGLAMFGNSLLFRLLLKPNPSSVVRPRNYIGAQVMRVSRNKGTKYTRAFIEWRCHSVSGTIFNTTTS